MQVFTFPYSLFATVVGVRHIYVLIAPYKYGRLVS